MDTEHAPTPWEVGEDVTGDDFPNPDTDIFVQINSPGYGLVALVDGTPIDDPMVEGNLTFILRACNSHDDLLTALEGLTEAYGELCSLIAEGLFDEAECYSNANENVLLDIGKDAIAKAKKEI